MPSLHALPYKTNSSAHFQSHFQAEHSLLKQRLCSLIAPDEQDDTTALLLIRLMFFYFLQRQGMLDGDSNYLSRRLHLVQERCGRDRFWLFYHHLFHHLFGHQPITANKGERAFDTILGNVPSFHTGLFESHEFDRTAPPFPIPDEAFAHIFALFDTYEWQNAEVPSDNVNSLQPDIISSLFEQYINKKACGAYYTAGDVTIYISQHTLIPSIFTTVQRRYPIFAIGSESWQLLRRCPDRYISAGLRSETCLPTETEREYQLRRTRYQQLKDRLIRYNLSCINDLVTYNLDAWQFALDIIHTCQDPLLLHTMYEAITGLTILDPTCGSGAFLFAAITLLESLYTACLERMEHLIGQDCVIGSTRHTSFHQILHECERHSSRSFFILKHIIEHNIYGVELMPAAVEICHMRLLLKLVVSHTFSSHWQASQPLRFHIRVGNTLVGFLHANEVGQLEGYTQAEQRVYADSAFAKAQTIANGDRSDQQKDERAFQEGRANQHPFHWCVEFPAIMQRGGFDVIIGNPPYVEYSRVKHLYSIAENEVGKYGNLYAAVIARSLALCHPGQSYLGLVVPLSICGGERFRHLRTTLKERMSHLWLANFEIFPSRLFESAFQRTSILLAHHTPSPFCTLYTTRIQRWYAAERPTLIDLISYTYANNITAPQSFPKLASPLQQHILQKIIAASSRYTLASLLAPRSTEHFVYYQEATNYWTKATCHVPFYRKNGRISRPTHGRILYFSEERIASCIMAVLNSSLFYTWFVTYSDGFHLSAALVKTFPLAPGILTTPELPPIACRLAKDMQRHTRLATRNTRPGLSQHHIEVEEYYMSYSKPLLDEIDTLLAHYYGFTNEELDFIINYDIKYRMGKATNTETPRASNAVKATSNAQSP